MKKIATLIIILLIAAAQDINAQSALFGDNSRYNDFQRRAFKAQLTGNAAQKGTAIKERLIKAVSYDYTNPPIVRQSDSLRYVYSGTRGSVHSPYDDFRFLSYYDNWYFFIRGGREHPEDATLFYDSCIAFVPVQLGSNVQARTRKQFDASGHVTVYFYQEYNQATGKLLNQKRFQYTYDAAYNCTKITEQTDTSVAKAGVYINTWINTSTYSGGRLMQDSSYNLLTATPDSKTSYTYDVSGNLTQEVVQLWNSGAWVNDSREIATYDALGRVVISQEDYATGGVFFIDERDSFGYTGSSATYTYDMSWARDATGMAYRKQSLAVIKLTSFGAIDTLTKDVFNVAGVSAPSIRVKAFYNAAQHLSKVDYYKYASGSWGSTPYLKSLFYYQTYNDVGISPTAASGAAGVSIYPIPASDKEVHLRFAEVPAVNPIVSIYDMSGRRLTTSSVRQDADVTVPISSLSPGVYSIQVRWGEHQAVLKLVKE